MEASWVTRRLLGDAEALGCPGGVLGDPEASQLITGSIRHARDRSAHLQLHTGYRRFRCPAHRLPRTESGVHGRMPPLFPANSTFGTRATIDRPKIPYRPSSGTTKVTWPSSGTTSVTPARHPLHPRLASEARVRPIADRHSWRRSLAVVLTSTQPARRRRK